MASLPLENVSVRITRNLQLQLGGVVLPGLLIVTELVLFAMSFSTDPERNPLEAVSSETKDLSPIANVLLITLLIALSYIVGRIARRIIFALALRLPRPTNAQAVYDHLKEIWPSDLVESVFRNHRGVWSILEPPRAGPENRRREDSNVITFYCIKWLGQNAADLEFDDNEIEINLLFASIFPVLLVTPAIMFFDPDGVLLAMTAAASLVTAVFLYITASQLMRSDPAIALRNFLIAHLVHDYRIDSVAASPGRSDSLAETSNRRGST
jgi:hypothetical protein